jgi:acyl-CoA synthetase (AMP-forming)/AMP-acid ligase II
MFRKSHSRSDPAQAPDCASGGVPPLLIGDRSHLEAFAAGGRIFRYAVPEQVLVVESIAKTSVGKPDKRALREQFAQAVRP